MAFKATSVLASRAFDQIRNIAANIRSQCEANGARYSAEGATARELGAFAESLANSRQRMLDLYNTDPVGVQAVAAGLYGENDGGYDITVEAPPMLAAINDAANTINALDPAAVNGSFTPAQLTGANSVVAKLTAVVNTIE